ncbi:hypothetical protein QAD02_014189 [Eretmocerus hayati]|uniref:Uncharacterized protein n=1 Tax=Eretmocerus hayati TaxID=131215 RepID=A0ACC2P7G1_9HYME|nr:hypothetical protein QAD02_014189 [Eretmocerus hayati]
MAESSGIPIPLDSAISQFLFDYRAIEHCTTGRSPSQLMFKRGMRTKFDVLQPNVFSRVLQSQRAQIIANGGSRQVELGSGDEVYIDDYRVDSDTRCAGKIVNQIAPSTFVVKSKDNVTHKRHIDQIVKVNAGGGSLRHLPRLNQL